MELFNLSHGVKDYANVETFVFPHVSTSITGLVFLFFPQKTIVFAVTFRYVQGVQFKFSLAPWEDANGAKPNAAHVGTARDWW